jgi:F-type H+-transporting ATPase subunit b
MFYFASNFLFDSFQTLFDLFENNIINWIGLVILLVYLWRKTMPQVFAARKERIESALRDAATARQEGQDFLVQQEQRLLNAKGEAEQILAEARAVAESMKAQIAEQTKADAQELSRKLEQEIVAQKQIALTELRSQAASAAIKLAESILPAAMTPSAKARLLSQFIEQLETVGGKNES